jgi:glycosyltransferase involved in cell wall biosynthesis
MVLTVSELEASLFASAGARNVVVLSHAVNAKPGPRLFADRRSILFVGAFSPDSPNDDAALFLCREILPALRAMDGRAPCVIGGARIPSDLKAATDGEVVWHADLADLTPLYDEARVFVAPMRFGAGISLKVIETAARGVPIVCTPLVAHQLGWRPGSELLTAESPAEFAGAIASVYENRDLWLRLRDAALARIARDYSPIAFRSALQSALDLVKPSSAAAGPRTSPA